MPKRGIVDIGFNVDYQKSLQEMTDAFKAKLTSLSNEFKKIDFSKDVAQQFDAVYKKIDGISEEVHAMFTTINNGKLETSQFEKYQEKVAKEFGEVESSIQSLVEKISILDNKISLSSIDNIASGVIKQFDDLKESVLESYGEISKVFELVGNFGSSSNSIDSDIAQQVNEYKKALSEIQSVKNEAEFPDVDTTKIEKAVGVYKELAQQLEILEDRENELFDIYDEGSSSAKNLEIERELFVVRQKIVNLLETMSELYTQIGAKNLDGFSFPDNMAFDKGEIDEYVKKATDFIKQNEKMVESYKETQSQIDASVTEFRVKNGAIHIPIEIDKVDVNLKSQLQTVLDKLQKEADKKTIIAKVKLTLDGSSSKGYKTNAELDKQQQEGQKEPAIDISKSITNMHRKAAREAEQAVRQSIKQIQNELAEVKVKITPEAEAFTADLLKMVESSLGTISKEGFKLNVNTQLEKLVSSLKEVSSSLSGNENFKFGLDEDSIKRITNAIENMANMIKRAFGVASDSEITSQWIVIEDKFKSVAGEQGKLLVKNKEHKAVIQELAVEYKKYLDMGGTNDLSGLTKHTQTVRNITKAYEDLGKSVEKTIQKQEKQNATSSATNADTESVKSTTRANKSLEIQADKTSTALEKEGNSAQSASEKFKKLAEEKNAAVVANRELAKAAKETADALEREAKANNKSGTKVPKNAVDEGVYNTNILKWQNNIKQSLLDSGNYEEIYGAKISQSAKGVVQFTASVRTAEDEWKKFTAIVDASGNIDSPKLQDLTEKQIVSIERAKEAMQKYLDMLASEDGSETESTFYDKSQMEDYVISIIEATQALDNLNAKYKVSLKSDGGLTITKELKEASGETKTFTANFNNLGEVIDEETGAVKNLADALEKAFDSGKFTTSIRNLSEDAKNLLDKFKLKNESNSNFSKISADIAKLEQDIVSINDQNGLDKFKNDLSELSVKLKNINADNNLGKLFKTEQTFGDINEVKNNLNSLFATMGKVNEKSIRIKNMNTLVADIQKANGEIHKMTVNLDSNGFARFVDNGISQFGRLREAAENVFKGIASLVRIYLSPQDFIRYFRQGFDTVKEIDTSMTELRKVSDASDGELATYFDDAVVSAKELGSSVNDMISATADWSRMGYNLPDSKKLGEVAVLYKNVGDGIDIDEANSSLVSTLQGFQMEASEAERIIDSFNEVSNNFAISSGGIGEALKRSAAAFNVANTDLNKSIALVTATNEVIQNPEKVGTLYQTVSARIRGAKAEIEEMGGDTDDMVESTSKLRDLVMGMTGFDIMKDENTYKDIYEIIMGIGQEWDKLKDIDRAALLEALAGKRQSNALAAVLGNLENLEKAYNTAENSAGSAQREQSKYMDSLQYSLDQLTAHGEEFWTTFINKDDVKDFINLLNGLIKVGTGIVDTFGSIPTMAGILGGFAAVKNVGRPKMYGLTNYCFELPTTISVLVDTEVFLWSVVKYTMVNAR